MLVFTFVLILFALLLLILRSVSRSTRLEQELNELQSQWDMLVEELDPYIPLLDPTAPVDADRLLIVFANEIERRGIIGVAGEVDRATDLMNLIFGRWKKGVQTYITTDSDRVIWIGKRPDTLPAKIYKQVNQKEAV